jgi:hypothetical protein
VVTAGAGDALLVLPPCGVPRSTVATVDAWALVPPCRASFYLEAASRIFLAIFAARRSAYGTKARETF